MDVLLSILGQITSYVFVVIWSVFMLVVLFFATAIAVLCVLSIIGTIYMIPIYLSTMIEYYSRMNRIMDKHKKDENDEIMIENECNITVNL